MPALFQKALKRRGHAIGCGFVEPWAHGEYRFRRDQRHLDHGTIAFKEKASCSREGTPQAGEARAYD